jgi:anti-sigma B factor antagonist
MSRLPIPFQYEVEMPGDTTTVKCHGRLVSETADELRQLVKPMIPKCRRIILDLSDVDFVDSRGLGTLVGLKVSAASAAYCSLEFVNFSPLVKDLLRTTKLGELLSSN